MKPEPIHRYFKLFACCLPVRGARRSALFDLQRGKIKLIPNALFDLLEGFQDKTKEQILESYDSTDRETVLEYIHFLEDNEYIFWCDDPSLYPKMDLSWNSSSQISNAIIDSDSSSDIPYEKIFKELESLNCQAIQLRYYFAEDLEKISEVLNYISKSRIKHVDILVKYSHAISAEDIKIFLFRNYRIHMLTFHSAPLSIVKNFDTALVSYIQEPILDHSHCGVVSPAYFATNLELFTESLNLNSCLNRKVAIDINGNIKNCPSLNKSFGNISTKTITEIVRSPDFQSVWTITKDQITTCKDCEFRYVCTDCRAFIEDSKDIYSKPSKCNYNPYTAQWE